LAGAVPPPFLRYRVDGSVRLGHFLAVGERVVLDMESALATVGRDLASFRDVLDFGCGCGRILRFLRGRAAPGARLRGTDIDRPAIAWCREHLPYASFATNDGLPPLDAPDGAFDLVYAISVFTHLDADRQRAWAAELARITRPGGVVLLTLHGPSCADRLGPESRDQLGDQGFLFAQADSIRGLFPEWYQASYQTAEHARVTLGAAFDFLGHIPRGICGFQDVVLLGKPGN
jgi:SAM-dependent methyltransferase